MSNTATPVRRVTITVNTGVVKSDDYATAYDLNSHAMIAVLKQLFTSIVVVEIRAHVMTTAIAAGQTKNTAVTPATISGLSVGSYLRFGLRPQSYATPRTSETINGRNHFGTLALGVTEVREANYTTLPPGIEYDLARLAVLAGHPTFELCFVGQRNTTVPVNVAQVVVEFVVECSGQGFNA